jgi:hypothetical protein
MAPFLGSLVCSFVCLSLGQSLETLVTTLAGGGPADGFEFRARYDDGIGSTAAFNDPLGVSVNAAGTVAVVVSFIDRHEL